MSGKCLETGDKYPFNSLKLNNSSKQKHIQLIITKTKKNIKSSQLSCRMRESLPFWLEIRLKSPRTVIVCKTVKIFMQPSYDIIICSLKHITKEKKKNVHTCILNV